MEFDSSSLGYILDFLAGFFIIQSIVLRSKRHIKAESSTLYDGNPLVYESQLKAFWDGWIGVVLLFIGLFLHLIHFEIHVYIFLISAALSVTVPYVFTFLIKRTIKKEVRHEHPHYDQVTKNMEDGKY